MTYTVKSVLLTAFGRSRRIKVLDRSTIYTLRNTKYSRSGIALVELLVAMGIMAIILPALVTAFFSARGGKVQDAERLQATGTVREAKEALRIIRDAGWDNVKTNGTYHPVVSGNTWALAAGAETVDPSFALTRKIELGSAYRDSGNNLTTVPTGNTLDPSVKRVLITATWGTLTPESIVSDYFLMRFEALTYLETLYADFSNANTVHRSTAATNTAGGEVVLSGSGSGVGDWCHPSLVLQALDLYHSSVPTYLSAIQGHAYATTGENASGDPLTSIDISNPTFPATPVATDSGSYTTNPQPKAYGVFATASKIYIATSKKTVDIINPGPPMTRAGYFDVGHGQGDAVFVSGNVGYVTESTTLHAFNLAGSINPAPELTSIAIAGRGKRIVVVGNYAYVATDSTTSQLQIFNVQNAATGTITLVKSINTGNAQAGVDVFVTAGGEYAYLVTAYANPDFFVYDLTNKSAPVKVGTYTTASNMIPTGVTVIPQDSRAIIVGSGSDLYQVLNISQPAAPSRCSPPLTFPGVSSLYAISAVTESDGDAYAYILTSDASKEFQMIQGGPGGGGAGAAKTGIFDSQIFAPPSVATFNRFDVNTTLGSGLYDDYQIAITNKVNGSCPGIASGAYEFVGPDKTRNTTFTGSSTIPLGTATGYTNPGECFRYRAILSTDTLGPTPVFNDITVNYSL